MTASAIHLYEATDAIEIVREWIFEHDEELRANEGVLPDELAELLSHVEGTFDQKAERVALFIREMRATVVAIKEEEVRIVKRRRAMENAADRLQRYLEANMLEAERMKIEGKLVTLRIQMNPPSVQCALEDAALKAIYNSVVSEAFPIVKRVPESYVLDKRAVLDAHKLGKKLPAGIEIERGASLRIV
jgi:RecB family endonuclease NucS